MGSQKGGGKGGMHVQPFPLFLLWFCVIKTDHIAQATHHVQGCVSSLSWKNIEWLLLGIFKKNLSYELFTVLTYEKCQIKNQHGPFQWVGSAGLHLAGQHGTQSRRHIKISITRGGRRAIRKMRKKITQRNWFKNVRFRALSWDVTLTRTRQPVKFMNTESGIDHNLIILKLVVNLSEVRWVSVKVLLVKVVILAWTHESIATCRFIRTVLIFYEV